MGRKIVTKNRKAYHDFLLFDKYEAGMVLCGTEIKSVRRGSVNLKDSFVRIEEGEAFLYNCHISKYDGGNRYNHEPERTRKLLLNKKEIMKILGKVKKEHYTIVPLEMYLENGWAKVEIALAKGKKLHDKRESIKEKGVKRDIARATKVSGK